ncbi:glycosyltransferase family 2 protein, partial [Enterobacter cloacae]|nr:glycosyltransferase [Enterobacter cloacae]
PEPYNLPFFSLTAKEQYYYLMFKSFNIAPTSFISRKALEDIGFADEKFTLIEDLPLWLKFTSKGYKLHFFPDITVYYRVENSTSKHEKRYVNILFLRQLIEINKSLKFRTMPGLYYMLLKLDTLVLLYGKVVISAISKNRVGNISKFLDFIHFALRPIYIMHKIRRSYVNYRSRKKALH